MEKHLKSLVIIALFGGTIVILAHAMTRSLYSLYERRNEPPIDGIYLGHAHGRNISCIRDEITRPKTGANRFSGFDAVLINDDAGENILCIRAIFGITFLHQLGERVKIIPGRIESGRQFVGYYYTGPYWWLVYATGSVLLFLPLLFIFGVVPALIWMRVKRKI